MTHGTLKITKSHIVGTDYQAEETDVLDRLGVLSVIIHKMC